MKINFHNLKVYNHYYPLIGAILVGASTYLDINKKADDLVTWVLLIAGLSFTLLAFKKPKHLKNPDDQN